MMFGTREAFAYFECAACGCLQIAEIPENMARHYPERYYSYSSTGPTEPQPAWKRYLKSARTRRALEGRGLLGRLAMPFVQVPAWAEQWFKPAGISQGSSILEAGCGQGHLLRQLASWGFTRLTGVDPFVASDLAYPDGVRVWRKRLDEMGGRFDMVMMHHAFEHMPDPHGTLAAASVLLAPGGSILLRIPLASSEAYRTYREDWVQLDAPRHLYLHTRKSLEIAAGRAGLLIEHAAYDSTGFQFWGSEQYRKGIPLFSPESYAVDPAKSPFSSDEILRYEERAAALNARLEGDQACFMLRRS
ncbi:MAG: class I SAM-dependent methyltransferase [Fibrobacteres bacterium]|nr:class I SAM-dependent methyltransferase [Fibrobacterota bacterium]